MFCLKIIIIILLFYFSFSNNTHTNSQREHTFCQAWPGYKHEVTFRHLTDLKKKKFQTFGNGLGLVFQPKGGKSGGRWLWFDGIELFKCFWGKIFYSFPQGIKVFLSNSSTIWIYNRLTATNNYFKILQENVLRHTTYLSCCLLTPFCNEWCDTSSTGSCQVHVDVMSLVMLPYFFLLKSNQLSMKVRGIICWCKLMYMCLERGLLAYCIVTRQLQTHRQSVLTLSITLYFASKYSCKAFGNNQPFVA